jgi:hypothetical protein
MKLKIFCRGSLFPSWSGYGLISSPVTLWRIRVTIVAIETQQCVPFVLLLAYMKQSKI